jgi:hypothetical protein
MQLENELGILVIRCDGSRAHIYRDIKQLLDCAGEDRGAVEFFSAAGHRLAAIYDSEWRLQDLIETPDAPNPQLVLERLRRTVHNMRDLLLRNPDAVREAGLVLEQGLLLLPELGEVPLGTALQTCGAVLSHSLEPQDDRSPWHNFWVHGIF